MKAAVRFLADDAAGFEAAKKQVFAKNPEYSRFLPDRRRVRRVGAPLRRHRRDDERGHASSTRTTRKAWADLGLNLIRAGDETGGARRASKGVGEGPLQRPRLQHAEPLREGHRDRRTRRVEGTPFRIRYSQGREAPILERYVPRMLDEAWASMVKRYGFTPTDARFIELYADQAELQRPHERAAEHRHPGRLLRQDAGRDEPARRAVQLGQRALARARARVRHPALEEPRAALVHRGARASTRPSSAGPSGSARRTRRSSPRSRRAASRPSTCSTSAFTHADDARDVTMAYYAASQILVFIAEEFGLAKIVADAARCWGEGKRTAEVIQKRARRSRPAELDRRFRAWLAARASTATTKQFVPDLHAPPLDDARKAREGRPERTRKKQVELALALFAERARSPRPRPSTPRSPNNPMAARRALSTRQDSAGAETSTAARDASSLDMIRTGIDGYAVRMMLADLAAEAKDPSRRADRVAHARTTSTRRWSNRCSALRPRPQGKRETERPSNGCARSRGSINTIARAYRCSWKGSSGEAVRRGRMRGESAMFVDVENPDVHALYATALAQTGDHAKAVFELESALLCGPPPPEAASSFARSSRQGAPRFGNRAKAKAEQAEALRLDPSNTEVAALKIP